MSEKGPTLGFIGTGLMGGPMVSRLVTAGNEVHVWNRDQKKLNSLVDIGAKVEVTPAVVAAKANVIFLCLTDGKVVKKIVLDQNGVAEGGSDGKLIIDFSTISPKTTVEVASAARELCGMEWIDAPVSGGVPGAKDGTLSIMCGGAAEQIEKVKPILLCLANRITHMGGVGTGQVAKLCNQLIVSANILAIAEAIALGRKSGIDVARLPEALAGGFADSSPLQIFGPRMATSSYEPKLGAVSTMLKDAESIVAEAEDVGLDALIAKETRRIYRLADEAGLGQKDLGCLSEYYLEKKN